MGVLFSLLSAALAAAFWPPVGALGSPAHHARERAAARLTQWYPLTHAAAAAGLAHPDPEVSRRCRAVLRDGPRSPFAARHRLARSPRLWLWLLTCDARVARPEFLRWALAGRDDAEVWARTTAVRLACLPSPQRSWDRPRLGHRYYFGLRQDPAVRRAVVALGNRVAAGLPEVWRYGTDDGRYGSVLFGCDPDVPELNWNADLNPLAGLENVRYWVRGLDDPTKYWSPFTGEETKPFRHAERRGLLPVELNLLLYPEAWK